MEAATIPKTYPYPAPESTVVAELAGVRKTYGEIKALTRFDLELCRGELVSLLGPNGAGKTTAVRLLLGLTRPDIGSASIFGNVPWKANARMRTGVMLQQCKVPETLRVIEHLELFASYYPKPRPLDEVAEAAGLKGLLHRLFGKLSGGQKQRVLFALALVGDPELLILDEPTAGLDVGSRRTLWREIRSLVSRGRSVLLTTHYLEEAEALADRVVVIHNGHTVATGTTAEVKNLVGGRLIRCITDLSLNEVQGLSGVQQVRQDGISIEILSISAEETVSYLLAKDPGLTDLEVHSAGLEHAFLSLTSNDSQSQGAIS